MPPEDIDPERLVWTPLPKEAPAKGSGRTHYRALRPGTFHDWIRDNKVKQVVADGGDPESVVINMADYELPEIVSSDKRTKDSPKRQREQTEDPEKKRIRKGGPPAIPSSWRNRPASELVMSFTSPEVQDGYTLVVLQSTSQVPAFGRYSIPFISDARENRVSVNPMGHEYLWAPSTNSFWDVCRNKNKVIQYGMAASHKECSLHLIDPVISNFMSQLREGDSVEDEDRLLQAFLPNCFEDTWEELINSVEPIDDEIQNSFGIAVEAFPRLTPKAFRTLRKILRRMAARERLANPPMEEEVEEEEYSGYNVPEFTQLLMNELEEKSPQEPWDPALRTSLYDQLTYFLQNKHLY